MIHAGNTLVLVVTLATFAAGCAPKKDGAERGSAAGTAQPDGAAREAQGDTGRVGNTFVVSYDSGPIDRLRIVRDTAGRFVVEGASGFPDGTKVTVTLFRALAGDRREPAAMARANVELGRFQSPPLEDEARAAAASGAADSAAGPATPLVRLLITVSFAPGQQSDAVLQASANGRRFRGDGMREAPGGYAVYEQLVEAPL
jgi:hypothetical protein